MICPHCKNEYFSGDRCPSCGLTEAESILRLAEDHFQQERFALAAENYGKLLHRDPTNIELWKKQASAFARMALDSEDSEELYRADVILREALSQEGSWETGHQYRIQIAEKRDCLDQLVREYRTLAAGAVPERAAMAARMLQVIQLTLRFKSEIPDGAGRFVAAPGWAEYLAAFWPLAIGLPFVVFAAQGVMDAYYDKQPVGPSVAMVAAGLFTTGFLMMFTIRRLRVGGKTLKKGPPK